MSHFGRSRFVYGSSDFTTELSARPWMPADFTVGGSRTSAAGIPASYIVRRDSLIELTLRFEEYEWPEIYGFIRYGQTAQLIQWYPDADTADDSVFAYLESPLAGERFSLTRMSGYERGMEITVILRELPGASTWRNYFPTEDQSEEAE